MKKLLMIFAFISVLLVLSPNASAVYIDFTSADFSSLAASNQNAFTTTIDGIGLTLTAIPSDAWLTYNVDSEGDDGIGVNQPANYDEIDWHEMLIVSFDVPVYLEMIYLTDLFNEGNPQYLEQGSFQLSNGDSSIFEAESGQLPFPDSNGEKYLNFDPNLGPISWIIFSAYNGSALGQNHDYSLGGLEVETAPVPEPTTILLVGTGLIGLVGSRRKFRKP